MAIRTENMSGRGPLFSPDSFSGGTRFSESGRGSNSLEREWWFKRQAILLVDEPQVVGRVDQSVQARMLGLTDGIFKSFTDVYSSSNNAAIRVGKNERKIDSKLQHGVIVNPVFLDFPSEITEALHEINAETPDRHDNNDPRTRRLKKTIQEKMPQVRWPLIARVGEPICERYGLEPTKHQNFTNLVMFEDPDEAFQQLPYDWNQWLHWSFMAKTGAFKIISAPLTGKSGQLDYDKLTLYTLEGAAPKLDPEVVAERLQVFGSADKVGDEWKELKGGKIAKDVWEKSSMVRGMQSLGKFAEGASPRLLSEPVGIEDFTDGVLTRVVSGMARFSTQAEGAMMQWGVIDGLPRIAPWDGVTAVTKSGKFGALKTDLKPEDIMAIFPSDRKQSEVDVVAIDSIETKGPSVEAGEFTGPLKELAQEDPSRYLTRLRRVSGGWVVDATGDVIAPVVAGIFHKHRGSKVSGNGVILEYDPHEPPVPCGTNLTYNITRKSIVDVVNLVTEAREQGAQAIATEITVENHGRTTLVHWPREGGYLPDDVFAPYKAAVLQGDVRYSIEVPQK